MTLNMPLMPCDYSYASILFEWNKNLYFADEYGGAAFDGSKLPADIESMKPDYELFGIDYSLGYTFRPCFRGCAFCKVKNMKHPDHGHHSIWEFHDARFKKICLLNNNTFMDPRWEETFEEIWDADLTVIDENGYDLRLLDEEKADALKRTRFLNRSFSFAWDRMSDEAAILRGMDIAKKYKLLQHTTNVFVLTEFDTTMEEDIYRCQKIVDYGAHPYVMPYKMTEAGRIFRRMMNLHYYRSHSSIEEAWRAYK